MQWEDEDTQKYTHNNSRSMDNFVLMTRTLKSSPSNFDCLRLLKPINIGLIKWLIAKLNEEEKKAGLEINFRKSNIIANTNYEDDIKIEGETIKRVMLIYI